MIACVSLPPSYSRRSEKGDVKERWENIFDPDSFIQQIRRAKETFSLIIMLDPEVRKQSYLCGSSISFKWSVCRTRNDWSVASCPQF